MQTTRLAGIIAVIGPLLLMVTSIELLSRWSGDPQFAALFSAIRIMSISCLVVWLVSRQATDH